jgi:hypothetical protein
MMLSGSDSLSGTLDQMARLCRTTPENMAIALEDLSVTKTAVVTHFNDNVTLSSRRRKRESQTRLQTRLRVRKHREKKAEQAACNGGGNENVPSDSDSDSVYSSLSGNGESAERGRILVPPEDAKFRVEYLALVERVTWIRSMSYTDALEIIHPTGLDWSAVGDELVATLASEIRWRQYPPAKLLRWALDDIAKTHQRMAPTRTMKQLPKRGEGGRRL